MSGLDALLPAAAFRIEGGRHTLTPATPEELAVGLQWARAHGQEVSVSRRRLDAIDAPEQTSCLVRAGAGATLGEVERVLQAGGLTLGPLSPGALALDVATFLEGRHAGLRAVAGGRLETAALTLEAALHTGQLYRSHASPRAAAGPDLDFALLGGGGALGLLTAATLRAQPLPTAQETVVLRLDGGEAVRALLHLSLAVDAAPWSATVTRDGAGMLLCATYRNLAFRVRRDAARLRALGGSPHPGAFAPSSPEAREHELAWDALPALLDRPEVMAVALYRIARESVIVAGEALPAGPTLDAPPAAAPWLRAIAHALSPGATP